MHQKYEQIKDFNQNFHMSQMKKFATGQLISKQNRRTAKSWVSFVRILEVVKGQLISKCP
jgi:hypothetical protein